MPPKHADALRTVLSLLPHLDAAGIAQVRAKLAVVATLTPGAAPDQQPGQFNYVLGGIVHELRRRGLLGDRLRPGLRQVKALDPDFEQRSADIQALLVKGWGGEPHPNELAALARVAAQALADDIHGSRAPVCLRTMVQGLPRMLGALDNQFPGYLQNGLLRFLLTQRGDGSGR